MRNEDVRTLQSELNTLLYAGDGLPVPFGDEQKNEPIEESVGLSRCESQIDNLGLPVMSRNSSLQKAILHLIKKYCEKKDTTFTTIKTNYAAVDFALVALSFGEEANIVNVDGKKEGGRNKGVWQIKIKDGDVIDAETNWNSYRTTMGNLFKG